MTVQEPLYLRSGRNIWEEMRTGSGHDGTPNGRGENGGRSRDLRTLNRYACIEYFVGL
jgi:hypothetical protein